MFLYELGVDGVRRRGHRQQHSWRRSHPLARERGCYGMWVLTDEDNTRRAGDLRARGRP